MIAIAGTDKVAALLRTHPRIQEVRIQSGVSGCRFGGADLLREVQIGNHNLHEYGLLELIDNNPLVCADAMSLPSLATSVALVCLGPLLLAGIVQEEPILVSNAVWDDTEIDLALRRLGWTEGVLTRTEDLPMTDIVMASCSAVIPTPDDPEEIADTYEERFGRSLLIDGDVTREWKPDLVRGKAACAYRISISGDSDTSLVTVRVMCDASGEFQAAQVVNALNIMSGFEDSLGLNLSKS